ncbi:MULTISPECIES: BlaI/MecI/CopY family transcriptional regulator [Anaerotruncus]|jgi:BlaI family penicillinase repressor|uniref:BlaI/MecI/CopY family transcriptional regulator n=1 Tax=Anaerotruncus TaxID=244127 RepID=UPI00082C6869|nr:MULTISPECIES: BlaI/MecI/CopY family transcriptional regulator [Anaerotruncus]RGX56758.1 BlaI/MecI/CopY family transcriptional regulator [Anaerotruncus sp. AF02-27]
MVKINDSELRFLNLLWEYEPVNSTELVRLCEKHLGWKKSTTYTVIRRLAARGIVKNENALVSVLVAREQVQKNETEELIDRVYGGSLQMFLASFIGRGKLSPGEAAELKRLIDSCTEED